MTKRSLENYAVRFGAQRQGFRRYLEGLLIPADRNKTLTALANTEPVVVGAPGSCARPVQAAHKEGRSSYAPALVTEVSSLGAGYEAVLILRSISWRSVSRFLWRRS